MIRLRGFLSRISVAGAFSWPTFWVVYALNLTVTFTSAFGGDASWWQRIIAVSLGQVALFAVLAVAMPMEQRILDPVCRGLWSLIAFGLSGAARGAAVAVAFIAWGADSGQGEWPRVVSGVLLGWAALTPLSILVDSARRYSRDREDLLGRRDELQMAADRMVERIEELDGRVIDEVRDELLQALSDEQPQTSADRLERVASEVVRPLSHELARSVPSWSVRELTVDRPAPRMRWREVLDRATAGAPFLPIATTALIALLSVVSVLLVGGFARTSIFYVIGSAIIVTTLSAANAVLRLMLPGRSLGWRIVLSITVAFIAGATSGAAADIVVQTFWGDVVQASPARTLVALTLVIPLFAIPLALGRAATLQRDAVLEELRAVDDMLARRVARLGMVQWSQQRELARALHGPVQAVVAAGAHRLRSAQAAQSAEVSTKLRADLLEILDPARRESGGVGWEVGVRRVSATWEGIADVIIAATSAALRSMHDDPVVTAIALEIITEAVSNAVRHGRAAVITGEVAVRDGDLWIRVADDGGGAGGAGSGIGTEVLRECSLTWNRVSHVTGTELLVTLPLGASAQ